MESALVEKFYKIGEFLCSAKKYRALSTKYDLGMDRASSFIGISQELAPRKTTMNKKCTMLAGTLALGFCAMDATATSITFTGSSGTLDASATFDTSGTNLLVTLTNTSSADVLVPTDVLTAVFFSVSGDPALTRVSAVLEGGSTVFYDPDGQPAGGVVGGEWAYVNGLSQYGANSGISSTGVGLFGAGDRFPGSDLAPPASPDGVQYGLLSAGDNTATGNSGITGSGGLIKNSVLFTLSGLPTGFDPSTGISNVTFQYGTALTEPSFPGCPDGDCGGPPDIVPEVDAVAGTGAITLLIGSLALVGERRRRKWG